MRDQMSDCQIKMHDTWDDAQPGMLETSLF